MGFADYFWNLATAIFKRKPKEESDAWKWFSGIGPAFDEAKSIIFSIREAAIIATATGTALDKHGKDRKLPRVANESDEDYRNRLLSSLDFYAEGGTESGMQKVLVTMGYPNAEVFPCYKEKYNWVFLDGSRSLDGTWNIGPQTPDANQDYLGRWSQIVIKLNTGGTITPEEEQRIMAVMNIMKPSESLIYQILP